MITLGATRGYRTSRREKTTKKTWYENSCEPGIITRSDPDQVTYGPWETVKESRSFTMGNKPGQGDVFDWMSAVNDAGITVRVGVDPGSRRTGRKSKTPESQAVDEAIADFRAKQEEQMRKSDLAKQQELLVNPSKPIDLDFDGASDQETVTTSPMSSFDESSLGNEDSWEYRLTGYSKKGDDTIYLTRFTTRDYANIQNTLDDGVGMPVDASLFRGASTYNNYVPNDNYSRWKDRIIYKAEFQPYTGQADLEVSYGFWRIWVAERSELEAAGYASE